MLSLSLSITYVHPPHLSVCLSTVEHDLDQIDYIDSCTAEEEESLFRQPRGLDTRNLSSQFVAYIEQRRISHEVHTHLSLNMLVSPSKNNPDSGNFCHISDLLAWA